MKKKSSKIIFQIERSSLKFLILGIFITLFFIGVIVFIPKGKALFLNNKIKKFQEDSALISHDASGCSDGEGIQKVKESVVKIVGDYSSGSGFIVSIDGFIVTNYHVVQNESQVHVLFHDGSSYLGEIYSYDPVVDIAIVKINISDQLQPVEWGEIEDLNLGADVIAIGYPHSDVLKGEPSITKGSFSAIRKSDNDLIEFIQTDTSLNPGNSGGPLIDVCGKVIGINELTISDADDLNFAISENTARNYVKSLIEGDRKEVIKQEVNIQSYYSPEEIVNLFYTFISLRYLDEAFNLLSTTYQATTNINEWHKGYSTTLNVFVNDLYAIEDDEPGHESVYVNLTAVDLNNDQAVFRNFEGVWHLIQSDNGQWMMDDGLIKETK
jgi:S1-C subfamily serine protease